MVSAASRSSAGADPRLVEAYRRLIRVYPRGPRREELLDTLIEAAPQGRRRPALREVGNLVCHGARARLGRPASRGIVVLAAFVALAGGFLGAAGANRLGWEAAGPQAVGAEAPEINRTVFPGLTVWGGGDAARIVPQSDGEGIQYGYALSWVEHTAATRDVATYTAGVRARLEAAGWTVTAVDPPLDQTDMVGADPAHRSEGFAAARGPLRLHFADTYWAGRPAYDRDGMANYLLWQEQPPSWLALVTCLGFLAGAVLAWLLTGWASRRLEPNPATTGPAAAGAVIAVLCVVPWALLALLPGGPADDTAVPSWDGLGFALGTPAVLFGLLTSPMLLLAAAQRAPRWPAAWRRREKRPAGGRRRRTAAVALITVTVLLGLSGVVAGYLMPGACTPSVPAGVVDPPNARMSYQARVFISPQATDDQRNLAQAAIGRGLGGGTTFAWDPRSAEFLAPYCGGARPSAEVAQTLPRHWTVDLASPGLFGGLAAETIVMPGVVAVQHVPL
jgi:hypothetical protein